MRQLFSILAFICIFSSPALAQQEAMQCPRPGWVIKEKPDTVRGTLFIVSNAKPDQINVTNMSCLIDIFLLTHVNNFPSKGFISLSDAERSAGSFYYDLDKDYSLIIEHVNNLSSYTAYFNPLMRFEDIFVGRKFDEKDKGKTALVKHLRFNINELMSQ